MSDDDAAAVELWSAVLLQAVKDVHGVVFSQIDRRYLEAHRERIRRETAAWFMDRNPASGFCCICKVLGLDPEGIRRGVFAQPRPQWLTRAGLNRKRFYGMGL